MYLSSASARAIESLANQPLTTLASPLAGGAPGPAADPSTTAELTPPVLSTVASGPSHRSLVLPVPLSLGNRKGAAPDSPAELLNSERERTLATLVRTCRQ